jgi:RNA-directed DNA polymerase
MMHSREKSDSAIVAGKLTNKAAPTAAEPVEPRAGAKGNASQQSTHRTQGRERVSQALERYGKPRKGRTRSSLRSSTTSASTACGWRSSPSNATPPLGLMD